MKRTVRIIVVCLILGVSGCALLADKPPPTYEARGRIENNFYVSPTGSFRVRLPELSSTGVIIHDEVPSSDTLLLSIKDDLCREFIVSQRPGNPGTQSVESWVSENIVQPLKAAGINVEEVKTRKTQHDATVSFRYREPKAAPCERTATKDGKSWQLKPDAEVAWYVFYHAGSFYRLIYVLGVGEGLKDMWFVKKGPADEILERFADGFQVFAAKEK